MEIMVSCSASNLRYFEVPQIMWNKKGQPQYGHICGTMQYIISIRFPMVTNCNINTYANITELYLIVLHVAPKDVCTYVLNTYCDCLVVS